MAPCFTDKSHLEPYRLLLRPLGAGALGALPLLMRSEHTPGAADSPAPLGLLVADLEAKIRALLAQAPGKGLGRPRAALPLGDPGALLRTSLTADGARRLLDAAALGPDSSKKADLCKKPQRSGQEDFLMVERLWREVEAVLPALRDVLDLSCRRLQLLREAQDPLAGRAGGQELPPENLLPARQAEYEVLVGSCLRVLALVLRCPHQVWLLQGEERGLLESLLLALGSDRKGQNDRAPEVEVGPGRLLALALSASQMLQGRVSSTSDDGSFENELQLLGLLDRLEQTVREATLVANELDLRSRLGPAALATQGPGTGLPTAARRSLKELRGGVASLARRFLRSPWDRGLSSRSANRWAGSGMGTVLTRVLTIWLRHDPSLLRTLDEIIRELLPLVGTNAAPEDEADEMAGEGEEMAAAAGDKVVPRTKVVPGWPSLMPCTLVPWYRTVFSELLRAWGDVTSDPDTLEDEAALRRAVDMVIGCWGNTKLLLRLAKQHPDKPALLVAAMRGGAAAMTRLTRLLGAWSKNEHANQALLQKEALKDVSDAQKTLNAMCNHAKTHRDPKTAAAVPRLKKSMDQLLAQLKLSMAFSNKILWVGNLKHRNLEGDVLPSQLGVRPYSDSESEDEGVGEGEDLDSYHADGSEGAAEEEEEAAAAADEAEVLADETNTRGRKRSRQRGAAAVAQGPKRRLKKRREEEAPCCTPGFDPAGLQDDLADEENVDA